MRQADQVAFAQCPGGRESRLLAVTMSGKHIGIDAEYAQQSEHPEARCADSWLRHFRALKFLTVRGLLFGSERRRGIDELPEWSVEIARKGSLGSIENLAHLGKRHRH